MVYEVRWVTTANFTVKIHNLRPLTLFDATNRLIKSDLQNIGKIMKTMIPLILISSMATGCASITGSKHQPVSVQTHHNGNQIADASCTLTNDKGSWFLKTPGSTTIQKSGQDLVVTCNKDGVPSGSTTVASSANGGVWGNILFGGLIGYAIDASTGAAFDYPTSMTVQMGQVINLTPPKPNPDGSVPEESAQTQQMQAAQLQNTSGGLVFDQTAQSPTAQKLRELKTLKDEGVLTQKEYDAKKAAVLKGM